jgi:hypothetical protein
MDNKKDKKESSGIDLSRSKGIQDGSLRKINFGMWFLKNRRYFFMGIIGVLITGSVILYSYFFYNLYDYIRYSAEERAALEELSNVATGLSPGRLAQPLEEGSPQSFFHNDRYDFIAKVKNPNNNFFAYVRYCFFGGEEELGCSGATLFPGQEKYLILLSKDIESRPVNLELVIQRLNWERVDVRKYPDWENYYAERNNFIISDIEFEIEQPSDLSFSKTNNLSFSIRNNSPYNYWEVPLTIILINGGNIVGVNRYIASELMSLESRDITISWSNSINFVSEVEVIPHINVLDEDNYIRYQ